MESPTSAQQAVYLGRGSREALRTFVALDERGDEVWSKDVRIPGYSRISLCQITKQRWVLLCGTMELPVDEQNEYADFVGGEVWLGAMSENGKLDRTTQFSIKRDEEGSFQEVHFAPWLEDDSIIAVGMTNDYPWIAGIDSKGELIGTKMLQRKKPMASFERQGQVERAAFANNADGREVQSSDVADLLPETAREQKPTQREGRR